MDVRLFLAVLIFFSASPAFASESAQSNEATDQIHVNLGAQPDPNRVNRSPAVLGPATDEPVVFPAVSADEGDQPIEAPTSPLKNSL